MPAMEPEPKRSPWRTVAYIGGFLVGTVAFLNGVPEFVDETLPWLAQRIPVSSADPPTVWDVVSVAVAIAMTAQIAVEVGLNTRRVKRLLERKRDETRGV
jgi:hypothetical protein